MSTSPEKLAELVGHGKELNRALACHPNATAELLEELMDAEDEEGNWDAHVRFALVVHPNVPKAVLIRLAAIYPHLAAGNPVLPNLVASDPDLLWHFAHLLEESNCPVELIDAAFNSGAHTLMLHALRNPVLPAHLRERLTPDALNTEACTVLNQHASAQSEPLVKEYVETYERLANPLPYAVPIYLPFDPQDVNHRVCNQVVCGFPYTSKSLPWPQDFCGDYMQPLAQIDLVKAGQALGQNLGDGLLQVWFSVKTSENQDGRNPLLRLIPKDALTEQPDDFYPDSPAWNPVRDATQDIDCIWNLSVAAVPSARVEWFNLGRMYPNPGPITAAWCHRHPELDEDVRDQAREAIEKLALPSMDSGYLDSKSRWIHLGGYVQGHGNEADLISWGDGTERVLFYIREEEGIFALVVTFSLDDSGSVAFDACLSSDY